MDVIGQQLDELDAHWLTFGKGCLEDWRKLIHWERCPFKKEYSGLDSVVQPVAKRFMKCQISREITISDHWEKRSLVFTAPPSQQARST